MACRRPSTWGFPGATSSVAEPVTGKRVLLAEPRGYCAGVDRAVETVERALEKHGAPVYVRHEIVHNRHVVDTLAKAGAVFVEETDEVPEGAIVVFSAHGVAPTVHATAAERKLQTIDATCPLVTKVHNEARRFARDDYDILLIGHEGHEEVVGTAGEAPDHVQLVDGLAAVDGVTVRDENKVIWLSQTTLSVDETMEIVAAAAAAFPEAAGSAQRRHLLRDAKPAGRGQGDGARVRAGHRRRLAQLVEFGAAGRGGVGWRRPRPRTWSTGPTTSIRRGWRVSPRWVSPRVHRSPRFWCGAYWSGWPTTATAWCNR